MRILRILAAVILLVFLLSHAGLGEVLARVAAANPWLLGLAMVAALCDGLCRTLNWRQLLAAMRAVRAGYLRLLGCYYYSALLGQFVPSTLGTDAIRVLLAQRSFGGSAGVYVASLLVLNAMSLFAGMLLALLACVLLWIGAGLPPRVIALVPLLGAGALAAPAAWLLLRTRRDLVVKGLRAIRRRRAFRARRVLRRFFDALRVFERASPGAVLRIVLVSSLVALWQGLVFGSTAAALGAGLPWMVWVLVPPLVALVGLLPLSVLGFGAQQGALVLLLTQFGMDSATALAVGLVGTALSTGILVSAGAVALASWGDARVTRVPGVA